MTNEELLLSEIRDALRALPAEVATRIDQPVHSRHRGHNHWFDLGEQTHTSQSVHSIKGMGQMVGDIFGLEKTFGVLFQSLAMGLKGFFEYDAKNRKQHEAILIDEMERKNAPVAKRVLTEEEELTANLQTTAAQSLNLFPAPQPPQAPPAVQPQPATPVAPQLPQAIPVQQIPSAEEDKPTEQDLISELQNTAAQNLAQIQPPEIPHAVAVPPSPAAQPEQDLDEEDLKRLEQPEQLYNSALWGEGIATAAQAPAQTQIVPAQKEEIPEETYDLSGSGQPPVPFQQHTSPAPVQPAPAPLAIPVAPQSTAPVFPASIEQLPQQTPELTDFSFLANDRGVPPNDLRGNVSLVEPIKEGSLEHYEPVPQVAAPQSPQIEGLEELKDSLHEFVDNLSDLLEIDFKQMIGEIKVVENLPSKKFPGKESLGSFETDTTNIKVSAAKAKEHDPLQTISHEIGHAIDLHIGGGEQNATNQPDQFPQVMKVIEEFRQVVEERGDLEGHGKKYKKYFNQPREMFANAVSEHLTGKTHNKALEELLRENEGIPRYVTPIEDEEERYLPSSSERMSLPSPTSAGVPGTDMQGLEMEAGKQGMAGSSFSLEEVLQLLRDIKDAIDRGDMGRIHAGSSGSGPQQHPESRLTPVDSEASEGFPQSSPSVNVSIVRGAGGSGGFGLGSKKPSPTSLMSGGTGKPGPTTSRPSFTEPGGR